MTSIRPRAWLPVLAGRDQVHPAETLMLGAARHAQQGRQAEAVYGLRAARAALEEHPSDRRKKVDEVVRRDRGEAERYLRGVNAAGFSELLRVRREPVELFATSA